MNIKNLVKNNVVTFYSYRAGIFQYMVNDTTTDEFYLFPIPVEDLGEATLLQQDKAMLFMRYIRKAIENNTLTKLS